MSHLRRILYLLVFLVFLIGCGGSSLMQKQGTFSTMGKLGNTTRTAWEASSFPLSSLVSALGDFSTPPSSSRDAHTLGTSCQPPSLDGCYTEAQMKDYLDTVSIPDIQDFSKYSYSQMPLPKYMYIPEGETASSGCESMGESTYAYCPADDTVYIGQKFEWELYSNYGSVAPVFGLAHEFGHHIQFEVGVPQPTNSQQTVNHEDQADCVAGAWVLWADQVAHIIEYPKDLQNIGDLLIAISDKEGPNQTHGTPIERSSSFELGYSSGLSACNSYYPNQPILVSSQ